MLLIIYLVCIIIYCVSVLSNSSFT